MTRFSGVLALALAIACANLALTGCRHARPPESEGRSSFQFGPAAAALAKTQMKASMGVAPLRDVVVDAQPIEPLAKPLYPKGARGAKLGVITVAVQITINADGRVTDVSPSLSQLAVPLQFSREFYAAIDAALAQWRFTPSEIRHMEEAPGSEGGTYTRLTRREKIEAKGEVVFTFSDTGEVWSVLRGK